MNIDKKALETGEGLMEYVKQIIYYQIFYKNVIGKDIKLVAAQLDMYDNKFVKDIFGYKNQKLNVEHNLVKPLCDNATSTFLGRVPDIVSNNKKESERISKFTLKQKHNEFEEEIYDTALKMSICGSGFCALYNEQGDNFPRYRSLNPKYTNVVYDCSIKMERLCAYHIYWDQYIDGGVYVCLIYTDKYIYAYKTSPMSTSSRIVFSIYPLNLFLINGATYSYKSEHGFNGIPIVEFINNKQCISDVKPALPQIGLYTALQNNRFQNVDDIMNYLLFIKNARLGNEKEAEQAISLIKEHRVIALEGDNVDAKFLSNPLNQTDIQKLADDYKNEIHYITHIPDFTSVEFTQNASDPILKAKTKPLLDLCIEKEKWFNKGYMELLRLTLDFVKDNDKKLYDDVKFDLDNIDLVYTHTLPSNDTDMVNNIVNLGNQGLLNPEVALQSLSFIPNVNDYLVGAYRYNEYVDKRKENNNNKGNNGGTNDTNLERQNEKVVSKAQQDNFKNFIKGKSQDISDNKAD